MTANQEKTIKTKKNTGSKKLSQSTKYVERRCKIADAIILEVNNEAFQSIFVILNDVYDSSVQLRMEITTQDFNELGFNISSKDLIDIAAWIRNFNSLVPIIVPDNERSITLEMLMDSIEDNDNNDGEIENENIIEEIITMTQTPEIVKKQ